MKSKQNYGKNPQGLEVSKEDYFEQWDKYFQPIKDAGLTVGGYDVSGVQLLLVEDGIIKDNCIISLWAIDALLGGNNK